MTSPNKVAAATTAPLDSRAVRKNLLAAAAIAGRRSGVSAERRKLPSDFLVGFNRSVAVNLCWLVRSPSPLPSPAGRGNDRQRVQLFQQHLPQTQSLVSQRDWEWFSLSQRERAGVRESRAHSPNGISHLEPLSRSSRRESALISSQIRWSGLTSAATKFMVREKPDAARNELKCDDPRRSAETPLRRREGIQ